MNDSDLFVLIIDPSSSSASSIVQQGLMKAGLSRHKILRELRGVARQIELLEPDVVMINMANQTGRDHDVVLELVRVANCPIALFVDEASPTRIEAAVDAGAAAFVIDGLTEQRVKAVLDLAITRHRRDTVLQGEVDRLRKELAERKVVERAKGLVMQARGLPENDAYALLRKTAMDKNLRVAEVARQLVETSELMSATS